MRVVAPTFVILTTVLTPSVNTGCGTFSSQIAPAIPLNPSHASPIYGGVRVDGRWLAEAFEEGGASLALTPLIILDMPLSAIADTLILPWTIIQQGSRNSSARKRSDQTGHGQ